MVSAPLIQLDFFLIDCSSIMAFSGADYANPHRFETFREQIWVHLENMIDTDKLKTVRQVWIELEYNDPSSFARLQRRNDRFTLPTEDETDFRVLNLISKYPKIIDHRQYFSREPADPYLIVYAQKWNVPIICDELPLAQRTGRRKGRQLKIPDVCDKENIECINLEKYLKNQGVIPQDYNP